MENNKYLEPKTSNSISELIKLMQIHHKNVLNQNSKGLDYDLSQPATHQVLPVV